MWFRLIMCHIHPDSRAQKRFDYTVPDKQAEFHPLCHSDRVVVATYQYNHVSSSCAGKLWMSCESTYRIVMAQQEPIFKMEGGVK